MCIRDSRQVDHWNRPCGDVIDDSTKEQLAQPELLAALLDLEGADLQNFTSEVERIVGLGLENRDSFWRPLRADKDAVAILTHDLRPPPIVKAGVVGSKRVKDGCREVDRVGRHDPRGGRVGQFGCSPRGQPVKRLFGGEHVLNARLLGA